MPIFDTYFSTVLAKKPYEVDRVEISVYNDDIEGWLTKIACMDYTDILRTGVMLASKEQEFQIVSSTTGEVYSHKYSRVA